MIISLYDEYGAFAEGFGRSFQARLMSRCSPADGEPAHLAAGSIITSH